MTRLVSSHMHHILFLLYNFNCCEASFFFASCAHLFADCYFSFFFSYCLHDIDSNEEGDDACQEAATRGKSPTSSSLQQLANNDSGKVPSVDIHLTGKT